MKIGMQTGFEKFNEIHNNEMRELSAYIDQIHQAHVTDV